jgi:hypothetical protein
MQHGEVEIVANRNDFHKGINCGVMSNVPTRRARNSEDNGYLADRQGKATRQPKLSDYHNGKSYREQITKQLS